MYIKREVREMLNYLLILLLIVNVIISAITLNKVNNSNEGYIPTSCTDICLTRCRSSRGASNFSNCWDNCMNNECIDQSRE